MSYLGSKAASGVYQKIIAEMPPHDTYIETHLGGGAVMLRKPPARSNWGIDVDMWTVEAFCQGNPDFVDALDNRLFIEVADALTFLKNYDFSVAGRVLVYSDPPYLESTRTSSARYRHEYTNEDHIALIECLNGLPDNVSVILSGYPSDLYDRLLTGWRAREFQAMTRGGVRTEKLWMNYPEAGPTRTLLPEKTTTIAIGLREKRSAGKKNLQPCRQLNAWQSWRRSGKLTWGNYLGR